MGPGMFLTTLCAMHAEAAGEGQPWQHASFSRVCRPKPHHFLVNLILRACQASVQVVCPCPHDCITT